MIRPSKSRTVTAYLNSIEVARRADVKKLHALIRKSAPQHAPSMVGNMIGYGKYRYRYASGREGEWFVIGLANQKNYISVYVCATRDGEYVAERHKHLLPKASIGKSCIRFKRLADIDLDALAKVIREGAKFPAAKV